MATELERLARDRPLLTRELHPPNAWYGHSHALKTYAGRPAGRPLKVQIEHAPRIDDDIWEFDAQGRLPIHLCQTPLRAAHFERQTGHLTRAIGPLIHYAQPQPPPPPSEPLTVAFPAHSTHHADAAYELDRFVERLAELREESEVVVCIYWRDVQLGLAATFEQLGYRCVTAGHMYDPRFLTRLLAILGSATRLFTNEVGTHILYAIHLGRPVWFPNQPVGYVMRSEQRGHLPEDDHPRMAAMRELFSEPVDAVTPEQKQFADELLGAGSLLSRAELGELLDEAEELYAAWPRSRRARLSLQRADNLRHELGERLRSALAHR